MATKKSQVVIDLEGGLTAALKELALKNADLAKAKAAHADAQARVEALKAALAAAKATTAQAPKAATAQAPKAATAQAPKAATAQATKPAEKQGLLGKILSDLVGKD